jgi:hypothetical protein
MPTPLILGGASADRTAEFCTPGEGHEKGAIEGEGGYFRRNHLVPVPRVADLDALNSMLLTACRADEARILDGRSETIGAAMALERGHLLACAAAGLDLAETVFPLVDKQGCVTVTEASLCKAKSEPIDVGALARYDRPLPDLADYDTLLSGPCAGTA